MSKPNISIVVLAYTLNESLDQITKRCVNSVTGKGKELIIVDNGSPEIYDWMEKKADKFIRLEKNVGYVKGMNTGMKLATCPHVVFVTSDTELISGKLEDMCNDNICVPHIISDNPAYEPQIDGIFYSTPNHPFFLHDEDYDFYFSDKDLFERAQHEHIPVEIIKSVVVKHGGWKTTEIEGKKYEIAQKALLFWLADEIIRQIRDDEVSFDNWVKTRELDGLLTKGEKQRLGKAAGFFVKMAQQGTSTVIEAIAKGFGESLWNKT